MLLPMNVATPEAPEELLALYPCTTEGVGEETPAAREKEMVLLGVGLPVPLPVTSAELLTGKETVEEGVLLVERVGLVEGVSLEVPEPVPVPMPELELDGVPVGVLLEVAVDEKEVVREMLPELLALAPSVRDPVGEADTELEALRVVLGVSLPVPEALCVPVLVGVPEGVVEGVGVDLWLGEPLKLAALVAVPVRVVL